ncbi:MAG: Hin recombinase [Beijerinckiaceae bacterium]
MDTQKFALRHSPLAKLRLVQAAMVNHDSKVGYLCDELDATRQTRYRFVGPKGEIHADGTMLLERKSRN